MTLSITPPTPMRGFHVRLPHLLIAVVALLATLASTAGPASAAGLAAGSGEYLVVSDPGAEAVYVYRASDRQRTGRLDGIELSGHAGTLQLPDGRLIGVDDKDGSVVAIRISGKGQPRVVRSADLPGEWEGAAWAGADSKLRYFAVSGGSEEAPTISVVDLRTFAVHQLAVDAGPDSSGSTPETQVYLAGNPLQLVYTAAGQFHTVPLSRVLADQTPTVTSTAPVGPSTHGPVVSRTGEDVYSTTADGFDGVSIGGATLGVRWSTPYSTTQNIVQMYRPRLATDGRRVWGSAAEDTGLAPSAWAQTRNNVNLVDLITHQSTLIRLPDGLAGRMAMSQKYGAVTTVSPDGDQVNLLDLQAGSSTFQRIVGTVAIPSVTRGPVAGTPTAGTQSHFTTLDPSGSRAFVSQGGDGEVVVVDTRTRRVIDTIDIPSALTGGGYLTVVEKGTPVTDLMAR